GWRWIERFKKFEEIEEKVNFLHRRKELAEWVKERVDKLGLNTFEIENMNQEDTKKAEEIKEHVIENRTDAAWLELFLAHHFITKEKSFEKAKKILTYIEDRDLLDEKSNIPSFLYHFLGQLYWKNYEDEKDNRNYFDSLHKKVREKETTPDHKDEALKLLKESRKYYEKSIECIEKRKERNNNHDDRSWANLAIVLIEIYKFYHCNKGHQDKPCLDKAREILEDKIEEKNHNIYYDLSRVYYYKGDRDKFEKNLEDFRKYLEIYDKKDRLKLKETHIKWMEEEQLEFKKTGFPGEKIDVEEFFGKKVPFYKKFPKKLVHLFKRKK
ncbi:MAG: hypothetical protein GTO45_10525, partial [Candidatus Aminicenantes bacterium]|nr:hypothetical protein [Candidatus Aminicenantes bacterium]NIM79242.1 hypothetical protein [Candidatus Aminicenantes bacterium]NIN18528.1 hypothetical protein [Candidatus Aminicenantes bacterium]NIN42424.1 hypothetical protein [Candidatus Aminicenantes bacterium]NIN85183.1 hypothetical protein [Candidatus Aminicenantes bacterium]